MWLLLLSCEGDTIVQQGETSNPVPTLSSLSPSESTVGGSAFVLTLTGSNFIQGSVAIWNGEERATEYVSATQISATILATDIETALLEAQDTEAVDSTPHSADEREPKAITLLDDTVQVWVRNPAPGGGTSRALPFVLMETRAEPLVENISPTGSVIGGPDLTLDVYGQGFHTSSVVRWNQSDLVTTYVNVNHLTALVPSTNQTQATDASITVFTGAPGGGTSNAKNFSVIPPNPVPVITGVSPQTVLAGGGGFTMMVTGSVFVPGAVVLWNGSARSTSYLGTGGLSAAITSSDIATGRTAMVSVSNPAPGGGVSNELPVTVENPVPGIVSLNPTSAAAGTPGLTVTIDGAAFVPASVARWDGSVRPTTFVNNARVQVALTPVDLANAGPHTISVHNPGPAGGTSGDAAFTIYISVAISANDLIYDPVADRIFASVPSTGGTIGNTISAIDPSNGAVVSSVFVGSEPNPLARSDNGQYLYVGLDGAAAVRRYVIATATADIQFELGTDPFYGPLKAEDMVVLSGSPGAVAISLVRPGVSPRHGGVFIYDDGVRRSQGTQAHTGSNRIEPSSAATMLLGYNNETTEFGFRQLTVSASGITQTALQRDLISGFGTDIAFGGDRVFATTGAVVNPVSMTLLGTLPVTGPVAPDGAISKVFVLDRAGKGVVACSSETFLKTGELKLATIGSSSKRLIRVGTDGVAFIASSSAVVIVRHPVFGP